MGTNGANFQIDTDQIVRRLKKWDDEFGLSLHGVGFDWVEAQFKRQPADLLAFAKEVYKFCPDVVDQGTDTVEGLASEIKKPTLSTSGPNASHHLDWVNENTVQRCLTKSRHVIVTVIANTVTGS